MEGLNLQMKTSKKILQYFGRYYKQIICLNYVIGWLLPFLIVVPSASVGFLTDSYMQKTVNNTPFSTKKYEICWLNSESLMRVYAVIIPISIMTSLNMIFIIRSTAFVVRIKKKDFEQYSNTPGLRNKKEFSQLQNGLKVFFLLTPVTGISWILLFLSSK